MYTRLDISSKAPKVSPVIPPIFLSINFEKAKAKRAGKRPENCESRSSREKAKADLASQFLFS